MNEARDYFVSYNRADREWAEWIAWQLEEAGNSAILQAWDFRAGTNFVLEMDRAASRTARTILVLSPDCLQSDFAATEWAAAFAGDARGEERRLIPVRVRPTELLGLLSQIVYIDLVNLGEDSAREALLTGVGEGRAKPSQQPPFPGSMAHVDADEPPFPGEPEPLRVTHSEVDQSDVLNEEELLERALAWVPPASRGYRPGRLGVITAGGPKRVLIRPAQLESEGLREQLVQRAAFGATKLFDLGTSGVQARIEDDTLLLSHGQETICLDECGTIAVFLSVDLPHSQGEMRGLLSSVLIEEEVVDRLRRALRFIGATFDELDPQYRVTSAAVVAALVDVGHRAWRTREEHRASPNTVSHPLVSVDRAIVHPSPAVQPRKSLSTEHDAVVEDLLVRLRRKHKSA